MLNKAFSKKKRWIAGTLAGVLAVGVVSTGLYYSDDPVNAKASLSTIEEYNQGNSAVNPFNILEIVPDYSAARIGYLVDGQEPAYYDDNGVKSLADMASKQERADIYPKYEADFSGGYNGFNAFADLKGSAFSFQDYDEEGTSKSFDVYGDFVKVDPEEGDYVDNSRNNDTYKVVKRDSKDGVTLSDIVTLSDERTNHVIYSDDVVLNFHQSVVEENGYNLRFQRFSKATDEERIPFRLYFDSDDDGVDEAYYEWNYYLLQDVSEGADGIQVEKTSIEPTDEGDTDAGDESGKGDDADTPEPTPEPGSEASYKYTVLKQFPTDRVTGLYQYTIGNDAYTYDYVGYVSYDSTTETFFFTDVEEAKRIPLNGDDVTDSLAKRMVDGSDTYRYYTVDLYNENRDADKAGNRLFIKNAFYNTTGTAVVSRRFIKKNTKFSAVKDNDPARYSIDINDTLGYHTFYYLPTDVDEFAYYDDGYGSHYPKFGSHNFVQNFASGIKNSFTYDGGFDNNEWFKQNVLDLVLDKETVLNDECAGYYVNVVTKKASEVTVEDINAAKLVYIQGANPDGENPLLYKEDIPADVAQHLLLAVYSNNKPVIFEGKALFDNVTLDELPNLYKLAVALLQPEMKAYFESFVGDWDEAGWLKDALVRSTQNSGDENKTKSYVKDSVFVVNGSAGCAVKSDFITAISNLNTFTYTVTINDKPATYTLGFEDVKAVIADELFLLNIAGKADSFNSAISNATCVRHIINFGHERTFTKTKINVLDIEPYYSKVFEDNATENIATPEKIWFNRVNARDNNAGRFTDLLNGADAKYTFFYNKDNRDIFDKEWFVRNEITQITTDDIEVKGMGTREFVGSIEDLSSEYDLIYIGLDTQYMNTEIDWKNHVKTNKTVYNDDKYNGLVYRHIGDTFTVSTQIDWSSHMRDSGTSTINGSGNDITFEKLRDLECYVKAGYAVLLSDDFYTYYQETTTEHKAGEIESVNTLKIDKNSYMHDFAKWVLEEGYIGKNVTLKHNLVNIENHNYTTSGQATSVYDVTTQKNNPNTEVLLNNRKTFAKYLSIKKLKVEVLKDANDNFIQPLEYKIDANGDCQYIQMNNNGVYTLDFAVKLTNDDAVDTSNTTYNCKLYIDHDADGRFESVEAINGLNITDYYTGSAAPFYDGVFHLTAGSSYYISRRVPEGYVGFLPWKLVFYENDRVFQTDDDTEQTLVRTSIAGYSAVPDYKNKPTIKILQIASSPKDGDNKWSKDTPLVNLNLRDDLDLQSYYQKVKDFNIEVDLVNTYQVMKNRKDANNDTVKLYEDGKMLDYFMDYDMVVMGFFDDFNLDYTGANKEAEMYEFIYNIRQYILSGKSMLFTHDLTNTNLTNDPKLMDTDGEQLGKYFPDLYLRDLQGMDRYGTTSGNLATVATKTGKTLTPYLSKYDDDYRSRDKDGNLIDNYGFVAGQMNRFHGDYSQTGGGSDNKRLQEYSENCIVGTNGFDKFLNLDRARRTTLWDTAKSWGTYIFTTFANKNGRNYDVTDPYPSISSENILNATTSQAVGNNTPNSIIGYVSFEEEGNQFISRYVSKLNKGQITEYPFQIEDEIEVAPTHPQYYQLNLDTDSQDKNYDDDIVVWYTISNQQKDINKVGFYTVDYNDARNNYYIYNKGNITYTGAGHSPVTGQEEKMLFVNTLVAAYNAGDHAPVAKYRKYAGVDASDITAMYEPYDTGRINSKNSANEGDFIEDTLSVHFKTVNNNLQNSLDYDDAGNLINKPIKARYYIHADTAAEATLTVGEEGKNPEYYKEIFPVNMFMMFNSNNEAVVNPKDKGTAGTEEGYKNTYNSLENYSIYTAKFNMSDIMGIGDPTDKKVRPKDYNTTIYIRLSMSDMSNGNLKVLPATESMSPLAINFANLYELK